MLHFLDTFPSRAEFLHLQPGAGWLDGDVGKVNLVATGPGQTMTCCYWPLQSGVGLCQLTFCHHIYPDLRLLYYLATNKIITTSYILIIKLYQTFTEG